MKISKGTIVRSILVVFACVNLILKIKGKAPIDITGNEVLMFVDTFIDFAIIIVGFWKNNSYSQNAIKADVYLQGLKNQSVEDIDEANF